MWQKRNNTVFPDNIPKYFVIHHTYYAFVDTMGTVKTKHRISLVVSLECAPIELKAALSTFKKSHLKLRRVQVNDRRNVSMFF